MLLQLLELCHLPRQLIALLQVGLLLFGGNCQRILKSPDFLFLLAAFVLVVALILQLAQLVDLAGFQLLVEDAGLLKLALQGVNLLLEFSVLVVEYRNLLQGFLVFGLQLLVSAHH